MFDTNFEIAHKDALYGLYGILILIALYVYTRIRTKKRLERLADAHLLNVVVPDYSPFKTGLRFVLFILAYTSFVIALAGPRFGTKLQEVKRKGIEVVIALDISNSMLAEDISPNRIEMAKLSIQKLIEVLNDDKVGIVVFAGEAYTQLPLTTDIKAAKMFLQSIQPDFIAKQGTAIGAAVEKSMRSFTDNPNVGKNIIIISDGENHEDDAVEKVKLAKEKGIVVHTIGMGSIDGAPIPRVNQWGQKYFQEDKNGHPVTTKLNESMLQEIAELGGGVYSRNNFAPVIKALNNSEEGEFEIQKYSEYDEKFQYFLGMGIIFLLLEIFTRERKNKLLKKVNLFEVH